MNLIRKKLSNEEQSQMSFYWKTGFFLRRIIFFWGSVN